MAPLRSPGRPQQWDVDPGLEDSGSSSSDGGLDLLPDVTTQSAPSFGPGYHGKCTDCPEIQTYSDHVIIYRPQLQFCGRPIRCHRVD